MKLAVLGGATQVDQYVLNHALRSGYSIHFLGPKVCLFKTHPKLTVATGPLRDVALIEDAFDGAHAVIALPHAINDFASLGNVVQAMHAFGIVRLIIAADLYQSEPRQFEAMLKKGGIDWTIVHYASVTDDTFTITDASFAKYLVGQITDASNLRSAMLLSN